ncbi:MAG: class I SAM-dependent methyltransferase [Bacteroidetes bacterium]|nr:class I SAM-dependent methyltransferase [Bacteroidota bacterium]
MNHSKIHESSFRDPNGFLFFEGEKLYRQINKPYQNDYELLMSSGLYNALCEKELLVKHQEIENHKGLNNNAYKVIEPEKISFISYPYEWSFSQLQDAALTTLKIQKSALQHGMTLKDGSAYNIQFHNGKPIFIDTLSFEKYTEGKPWEAYKQFCQHFIAPLSLMSFTDIRLNQLLKLYIDGIPLDLSSSLLPFKTRINFLLLLHIHLHARSQKKYESKGSASKNIKIKLSNLTALIDSLTYMVRKFKLKSQNTEWGDYYTFTNYNNRSFTHKKEIIASYLNDINPKTLWDLGANTGEFTRIASQLGINCIAFDIDPLAVESNYNFVKQHKINNLLPLVMDLTNPSPSIGWNNNERMAMTKRTQPDAILALAIIHHLAISNNLPFVRIAQFFSRLSDNLIIEFVPKTDSQVKKLLESRKDIFQEYDELHFEKEFSAFFEICAKDKIEESERIAYRMKRKIVNV